MSSKGVVKIQTGSHASRWLCILPWTGNCRLQNWQHLLCPQAFYQLDSNLWKHVLFSELCHRAWGDVCIVKPGIVLKSEEAESLLLHLVLLSSHPSMVVGMLCQTSFGFQQSLSAHVR